MMNRPILFLDGECVMCSRLGRWIKTQTQGKIDVQALQGKMAQDFFQQGDIPKPAVDSVLFWDGRRYFTESDAALKVVPYLGWKWFWLRLGWLFPRFFRNVIYRWVARNRKKWFGEQALCELGG